MTKTNLAVGEMPRVTKRTTFRDYDADLELARAVFDDRTAFAYSDATGIGPADLYDQMDKSILDALNNEWERDITVERWVERAIEAINPKPRRR